MDTYHWAYGTLMRSASDEGVFYVINIENDENVENESTGAPNNNPKVGLVWSDDGINWGNMEYYMSNKESGYVKDVSNNGPITETELFNNNCLVIDAPWGNSTDGFPNNQLVSGCTTFDKNLILLIIKGEREGSVIYYVNDLSVMTYNVDINDWESIDVSANDIGYDINLGKALYVVPTGNNAKDADLFIPSYNEGTYGQYNHYRLMPKSVNKFKKIETLTNYTSDFNSTYMSPTFKENRGFVFFTLSNDGSINLIHYDKRWRKPTSETTGNYATETWVSDNFVEVPDTFTEGNFPEFDANGNIIDSSIVADTSTFDLIDYTDLDAVTSDTSTVIPPAYEITTMVFEETAGNDFSINVGTVDGSDNIISDLYIQGNELTKGNLLKSVFSKSEDTSIYITSPNWNSASLDINIRIEKF